MSGYQYTHDWFENFTSFFARKTNKKTKKENKPTTMSKPNLGDRVLITSGTYGGQYGLFVGATIGIGKRGKVLLDFDQKVHRLSYTKMLVLPEAAIVVPSVQNPSPSPSTTQRRSPPTTPSPVPTPTASNLTNTRHQASPTTTTVSVTSPSEVSPLTQSELEEYKNDLESKLSDAKEKLHSVTEQLEKLHLAIKEVEAILEI